MKKQLEILKMKSKHTGSWVICQMIMRCHREKWEEQLQNKIAKQWQSSPWLLDILSKGEKEAEKEHRDSRHTLNFNKLVYLWSTM